MKKCTYSTFKKTSLFVKKHLCTKISSIKSYYQEFQGHCIIFYCTLQNPLCAIQSRGHIYTHKQIVILSSNTAWITHYHHNKLIRLFFNYF